MLPIRKARNVVKSAIPIVLRAPNTSLESISLPKLSVPSKCYSDQTSYDLPIISVSPYGAIKGAKIETIAKNKITTIPNFALNGADKKVFEILIFILDEEFLDL